MNKITLPLCIVCLSVFICSCLDTMMKLDEQISFNLSKSNELAIAKQIATGNPTGDYTGKYVINTDKGDGWIKINHYKNGLLIYGLDVDAVNGRLSISNGRLKLGRDADAAVSENIFDSTKMRFKEGLNKQGNKTIIVELFYKVKPIGTFIKTESKAQNMVKDD